MDEPDRVADLVSRELPEPGEGGLQHRVVRRIRVAARVRTVVGRQEPLEEQVVLPHAERAERDVPLDDLARPRVGDGRAVAPAARGAVDPLDDVVAHVHHVGGVRQHLHLEGVSVAGGGEGVVPPAGTVEEGAADGLGGAGVEVVDDRLDGGAQAVRRGFVGAGQPVPGDQADVHVLVDRAGVVDVGRRVAVAQSEEARPRVERARLEALVRQRHERVAHAEGDGVRVGGDAADVAARVVAGEGQARLQLGVLRKGLGHRQVRDAPARVQPEAALARLLQLLRDAVDVAHDEVGGVHEDAAVRGCRGGEAPHDALGEGVADGLPLGGVVRDRAVAQVRLHEEHPGSDALEVDHALAAELPAVQPDVVRPQPGRERVDVQERLVLSEARDLQPNLAGGGVPVEREEAVGAFHPFGFLGDGRQLLRRGGQRGEDEQTSEQQTHESGVSVRRCECVGRSRIPKRVKERTPPAASSPETFLSISYPMRRGAVILSAASARRI